MSPPLLSPEIIAERLAGSLPRWRLDGNSIARAFRTSGWKATLMAANAIGHVAELAWHHPELHLTYASIEVRLSTHDSGGVTERDLALAQRIEMLLTWRPAAEGGALEGIPDDPRYAYILPDT